MVEFTLGKLNTVNIHVYTFFELCLQLLQNKIAQFFVGFLEYEIVNDDVEVSWLETVLEFNLGCVQTLSEAFFRFGVSLAKSVFQFFDGWRLDEHENWIEMGVSDLFNAFDFNVQHANFSCSLHSLD